MKRSLEQFGLDVMSGRERSLSASVLRGALRLAEPFYAGAMTARNGLYQCGVLRSHDLGRATVSVGNLTAGGTGKTPVVRWLAESLRRAGKHPAILLRGYRKGGEMESDEAVMLDRLLNGAGIAPPVWVRANPSRIEAAAELLREHPEVDFFLLDDAFQHRRARRDFDLVLVDASNPFGFGHVHPRGLLREPVRGIRRADAVLLTRTDAVPPETVARVRREIERWRPGMAMYQSAHVHGGLRTAEGTLLPLESLGQGRFFAFSGIGRPEELHRQLAPWGACYAGHRWFGDHHPYSDADLREIMNAARAVEARALVTTEKDWAKLAALPMLREPMGGTALLPVWRLELTIQFAGEDGPTLLDRILACTFGSIAQGR